VDGYVVVEQDTLEVYGLIENTQITPESKNKTIPLFIKETNAGNDFVIQEIFFTGTVYPDNGKQYNSGKYFKIYNNSSQTLYADGLLICQSNFNTWIKESIAPVIFNEAFPVKAILMLPGSGKEYPVEPGESLLVCDNAVNHNETNPGAVDMTPAAVIGKEGTKYLFEFPTTNPSMGQADNPIVPNAQVIYSTLNYSMFFMHNRGAEAYALARLGEGITKEQYLSQYKYDYVDLEYDSNESAYKIPNEWIADAVTVSTEGKHEWLVVSPSLDKGWTYCSLQDGDKTRYDTCVRRKIKGVNGKGIKVLKDTNNSREDFIPRATIFLK
jgi:hypothetical protein